MVFWIWCNTYMATTWQKDSKGFLQGSLRWQLVIWSLLTLMVLLACQALWFWRAYQTSRQEARQTALATAASYAGTIRETIQQGYDIVSLLGLQFRRQGSLSSCQRILDDQLTPLDQARLADFSVIVFDASGQGRCHHGSLLLASPTADGLSYHVGSRRFFKRAQSELSTRVSGYIRSPRFREPVMAVSTPILQHGAFAGLIVFLMPAQRLTQLARELRLPEGSWLWLLDRERRLAASSDMDQSRQAEALAGSKQHLVSLAEQHCPGTMSLQDGKTKAIIACQPLQGNPPTPWLADAGLVLARWEQPALLDPARLSYYFLIPTVVGIPFLLLFWIGNLLGLLHPIEELTKQLSKKQLVREKNERPLWLHELKQLGKHIHRMQKKLERTHLEKLNLNKRLAVIQKTLADHEHELAERLRKTRLQKILFEHAPEGLVRYDISQGCYKAANIAFCGMSGITAAEIPGLRLAQMHPPEELPWIEAALEHQLSGLQSRVLGVPMCRPDGTVWYADINTVPLGTTQDAAQEAIAVFHDATARVQLEKSEERRRKAEGLRISLLRIMLTPQALQTTLNRAVVQQLADRIKDSSFALYRSSGGDRASLDASCGTALFQESIPEESIPLVEKQGIRLFPIADDAHILGYLAACLPDDSRNAPERFDALLEWAARQLATTWISMSQRERLARYAQEQEQQARLLAQTNQELERANRAKDEFLATMSHELRTPLNAIIGFSEVLRDGLGGPLNAEQLDYTQEILRASQHLLELINNILDLAKLQAGHMALDAAPTDMAELCQATQHMVRELASNKGITLTVALDEALTTKLVLDRRKVKQILLNLLSNAIKFTPMGGAIELRCTKVSGEAILACPHVPGLLVPPHAIAPGQYLELRVQDSGIGIPAEHIERLFMPFEQLDSSLARHHEGTGLGLSLVKRFAELHGGLVGVASTPGAGSAFTVWLPWREAET